LFVRELGTEGEPSVRFIHIGPGGGGGMMNQPGKEERTRPESEGLWGKGGSGYSAARPKAW